MQEAAEASVDVAEVLDKVVPMPPKAEWLVMFENGTWIKNALEKINRILPDVGVFSTDYVCHDIEDGEGNVHQVPYFFLNLCQELKERNGMVFLQYPLHHARVTDDYVDKMRKSLDEDQPVPMPTFAGVISQLLGSLRNSTDRSALDFGGPMAQGAAAAQEPTVSNQAKLVVLTLENHKDMPAQMLVVKPLTNNPFKDGKGKAKRTQTTMFASVQMQLLFEEYNKSHAAIDRSHASAMQHYMCNFNFDMLEFRWSVHNMSSADMHHTLTKTVASKQAPREYMQSQGGAQMVDGDVLARFRLFAMMDTSQSPPQKILVLNIQVMNQSTHQMFDVRYPTVMHTQTPEEAERDERQEACGGVSESMRQSLLRRVRFVKIEAPLMDEDVLSQYVPSEKDVLFDEYYAARTLAPIFSSSGAESFTLYFGYARDSPGQPGIKRGDVSGKMLIDVNRVAVDDRVA
jgi:hypothetical protein